VHVLLIIFFIVVFIQLIFITAFLWAFQKKRKPSIHDVQHGVSVIVCAHDEEENLRELIPQLLSQEYPDFEVIIVNDRSNDNTHDLLRDEALKDVRLRIVTVDHLPPHVDAKKYGITLAIKVARHEIILLSDSDCRPNSNFWISSISECFDESTNIVLGYSPYKKEKGLLNMFIRFETLFTAVQYFSFALLGYPYMGVGRNLAYRKSLFLEGKGFKDVLHITGGDDDLFVNRHATPGKVKTSMEPDSLMFSEPKKTWMDFFFQKVRHLSVGKRYKVSHKILIGLFSLSFLFAWILGLVLLFSSVAIIWVISALLLRTLLLSLTIQVAANRFGHKFEGWFVPVLDFLFVIYYISTGSVALLTNRVRWRN